MPESGLWITDWGQIKLEEKYIVCPIHKCSDGTLGLGSPISFYMGWQAVRLLKGCYAALLCPPFNGVIK